MNIKKDCALLLGYLFLVIAIILGLINQFELRKDLKQAQRGDLNLDGQIEITDLSIMADNWGK